jgi:integrase
MALLSFADSTPRAYRLKAGNACPPISTLIGTSSATSATLSPSFSESIANIIGCKSKAIVVRRCELYLSGWNGRSIESITRADVKAMLADIKAPIVANRVHALVRTFFNWAVKEGFVATSPAAGIDAPSGKETPRERILSDDELRRIWRAAPEGPYGAILKLAILTGQRRSEISEMQWSELDGDTWVLPEGRTKNGKRHEVPLSDQAKALLDAQPLVSDTFVFSYDARPFASFGKAKERLDAAVGFSDWVFHDLRRTVATGLAALGVDIVVTEKVLNHISGSLAGIAGVYQKHMFTREKREALQKWADHVDKVVRP